MNVQELIEQLSNVTDKSIEVVVDEGSGIDIKLTNLKVRPQDEDVPPTVILY